MYLITTGIQHADPNTPDKRVAVADIRGLPRLEALAGLCECFGRDYVLAFDGVLDGLVTYTTGPGTIADGAIAGVVVSGQFTLTWHGNTVVVMPARQGFEH
jgi:hypothetical protein